MAGTALDASVIVAALVAWHEAHVPARAALEAALADPEPTFLPVHALLEAYSVLTRLPIPRRVRPEDAWTMLSESLLTSTRLAGLEEETWAALEQLAERSIGGGMTYDSFIVASARKAGATRILTLNARHFERLVDDAMEICVPGVV